MREDPARRVVHEARNLVLLLRETHPDAPYEDLERALRQLDAYHRGLADIDVKESLVRVYRHDLEVGTEYLLHVPAVQADPILFEYQGESENDTLLTNCQFRLKVLSDGYAPSVFHFWDAGLVSAGGNWHSRNRVTTVVLSDAALQAILKKVEDALRDVDLDMSPEDDLNL